MLAEFGRFLQQQASRDSDDDDEHCNRHVEQLVSRAAEAVLLPDRRAALQELKDLLVGNARAQMAFGSCGFPMALGVVRDREDLESVQLALESLAAAVGGSADAGGLQAASINAQQLARSPEGLPLLLSLLEPEPAGLADFYARYHTLQVLKGLVAAAPLALQQVILSTPLGLTRLMDVLNEQEVLRNEALLLLTQLAGGSPDLQKVAAFEGAFDRLLGIIRDEGGMDGDIVVQDCFQLLAALLRGSPPNQLMFRETGLLAQLLTMLRLPDAAPSPANGTSAAVARLGGSVHNLMGSMGAMGAGLDGSASPGGRRELPPQKAANLVAAMEVVLALLPPPCAPPTAPVCPSAAENRQALLHRGLMDVLVGLGLQGGGLADDGVRAQALLCLAALVGGSGVHQDQLAALVVKDAAGHSQPLLQAVLHAAVASGSAAEQLAADRLLEAYCTGNSAGQGVLAGSLLNATAAPQGSFGAYLQLSLGRQGSVVELAASSRAAAALSHLIPGNEGLRPHLLAMQVQMQQPLQQLGAPKSVAGSLTGAVSLMTLCTAHLGLLVTQHGRQPASLQAAADTLRLLLLWLHACPPAVTAFLRSVAQSQPFLVDSIRGSNACSAAVSSAHPLTRGMLALLLGLCASYAEEGAGTPTQQQLLGAIDQQIGQQQFLAILNALLQHPLMQAAGAAAATAGAGAASGAFVQGPAPSPAFVAFLQLLVAEVRQRITGEAAPLLQLTTQPSPYEAASAAAAYPAAPIAPAPPAANGTAHRAAPLPRPSSPLAAATPPMPGPPAFASYGGSAAATRPYSPKAHSASPSSSPLPPVASVPLYPSAAAAAVALHSPRSGSAASSAMHSPRVSRGFTPPPPPTFVHSHAASVPGSHGDPGEAAHLQQLVEALQRENQQLRSEQAALEQRLRLAGSASAAGTADGHAAHAAVAAAEAAAQTARQQAAAAQAQLAEAVAAAERARGDAQAAQAAARKLETDLEDLSAAYSTLDAHAGSLQQQLDGLHAELAAVRQQQASAGTAAGDAAAGGGVIEDELQRRVDVARAEAAAEAQGEADEAMTDLLVCLGQEEAKVARLRQRLEAFGVDVDALVADIVAAGEPGDEQPLGDDLTATATHHPNPLTVAL